MIKHLARDDSVSSGRFGAFCPYWSAQNGAITLADSFEEMLQRLPPGQRIIDPVSVLALLQYNYMLGDRTLVPAIRKLPPRATLHGTGEIQRHPPLPHGSRTAPATAIAERLLQLLEDELVNAVGQRERVVHVLLSGGLDSRIVAGVLHQARHRVPASIRLVTWGLPESRDVVYARRVGELLGWDHHFVDYTAELAWRNVLTAATWGGVECTGIHLHGLDWFRGRASDSDLVIAATLGDSMGRAVYCGRHISRNFTWPVINSYGLLPYSRFPQYAAEVRRRRAVAWDLSTSRSRLVRIELDMQENFLHRMLCHALDYVREFCDLHQAFSSDDLVEFIWSFSPNVRRDEIYFEALRLIDSRLAKVPWARTGLPPGVTGEADRELAAQNHDWVHWPRCEMLGRIRELFFSPELRTLGIFHEPSLDKLWRLFTSSQPPSIRLNEDVLKVCSIEIARRHFGLRGPFERSTGSRRFVESTTRRMLALAAPAFATWRQAKLLARKFW